MAHPTWRVTGADARTGRDVERDIPAESEEEAARAAQTAGILVERVTPVPDVDPLQALGAAATASPAVGVVAAYRTPPQHGPVVPYRDIVRGAMLLRFTANVFTVIGVLIVGACSGFFVIDAVVNMSRGGGLGFGFLVSSLALVGPMLAGALLLVSAVLLRFVAALGIALRDIAIAQAQ
jgi:hypothetical protein